MLDGRRQWGLAALLLVVVCFSLWLLHASLQAEKSEARRAYEVLLEQAAASGWATAHDVIAGPWPAPEDNAAPILQRAFEALATLRPLSDKDREAYDYGIAEAADASHGKPGAPDPALHERLRRLLDERAAALDLLREGLAKPACRYTRDWSDGSLAADTDTLSGVRMGCNWLSLRGYIRMTDGNLEGACDDLESAVRLSDTLSREASPLCMILRAATIWTYLARAIVVNPDASAEQVARVRVALEPDREHESYLLLLQAVMADAVYLTESSLDAADEICAAGDADSLTAAQVEAAIYRDAEAVLRRTIMILEAVSPGWHGMVDAPDLFQPMDRKDAEFTEVSATCTTWLEIHTADVFQTWAQDTAQIRTACLLREHRARTGSLPDRVPASAPHDPVTGEPFPWNPRTRTLNSTLSDFARESVAMDWMLSNREEEALMTLPE